MKQIAVLTLGLALTISPALAKGTHITCELRGTISHQGAQKPALHLFRFYLDDTGEKLISDDSAFGIETTLYSDTKLTGNLTDISVAAGIVPTLFGHVLIGPAILTIDRISGEAYLASRFLDNGADFEYGACHVITPPATRF